MKMKGKILFLFVALLAITACKKDKSDGGDPFDAKYSKLTVDENKENVENASIDLVNELGDLEGANAFQVLFQMENLMGGVPAPLASHPVMEPVKLLASFYQNKVNTTAVFSTLKSTAEDPANLTELWDQVKAKYTWNFSTSEFDSTGSDDALIVEFPGKESDLTNTAVLTIDGLKVFEVTDPREDWPTELAELPKGIQMELKYNGDVLMTAEFTGSYKSDGMPTEITSTLTIEDFKFSFGAKHSPNTKASVTANLKRGSELLMEIYFDASGDWSEESINQNVVETYDTVYTWEWNEGLGEYVEVVDYIDTITEPEIEEIIQNANAHFIFMNVKIAGKVDFKKLGDVMRELDNEEMSAEDASDALVKALNENAQLVVVYTDDNKKIAEAEAYTYEDGGDFYPMIRFVYADDTKIDATTYLQEEMNTFFDQLNELIDEINTDFEVEIDPIDPSTM
jgi:hypothetical protein